MERNDQNTDGQSIPNNVVQLASRVAKPKPGEKPATVTIYEVGHFGERRQKREIWGALVQDFASWSSQFYLPRDFVYKIFSLKNFPCSSDELLKSAEDLFCNRLDFSRISVAGQDDFSILLGLPKAEYDARKMLIIEELGQLSTSSQSR